MADDSSSMMIVVVLIIAMIGSSLLSVGGGFLGYQQGWFDDFLEETDPPDDGEGDEETDPPDEEEEDKDDTRTGGVPKSRIKKSIFIYSKSCTAGDNWHRFLAVMRKDENQAWMHCRKDKSYNVWVLENTQKWYFYIQNKETGKYLTHDGDNLRLTDKMGDKSKWSFKLQKDTTTEYAIKNKGSGRFLNVHGNSCPNWTGEWGIVLRVDASNDDEKSIADSSRWKIALASNGPSNIVPSGQANCPNE